MHGLVLTFAIRWLGAKDAFDGSLLSAHWRYYNRCDMTRGLILLKLFIRMSDLLPTNFFVLPKVTPYDSRGRGIPGVLEKRLSFPLRTAVARTSRLQLSDYLDKDTPRNASTRLYSINRLCIRDADITILHASRYQCLS